MFRSLNYYYFRFVCFVQEPAPPATASQCLSLLDHNAMPAAVRAPQLVLPSNLSTSSSTASLGSATIVANAAAVLLRRMLALCFDGTQPDAMLLLLARWLAPRRLRRREPRVRLDDDDDDDDDDDEEEDGGGDKSGVGGDRALRTRQLCRFGAHAVRIVVLLVVLLLS